MKKHFGRRTLLLALAIAGLIVFFAQLAPRGLPEFNRLPLDTLFIFGTAAVVLQMAGHWLRAVKHRYLLGQIRPIRTADVFKGQMIGLLFNTVLPLRLGEIVRAHYIGKQVSISRSAVFATIVFERWLDTVILTAIGIVLLACMPDLEKLAYVTVTMAVVAIAIGYGLYAVNTQQGWLLRGFHWFSALFNKRLRDRLRLMAWSGIYCLNSVLTRVRMSRYVALSLAMWLFYGLSTFCLIAGLLPLIPGSQQILAAVAAYFGVSMPSGPAYLGSFQEVFASISNLPGPLVSFGLWFLLIVPTSILGFVFLLQRQKVSVNKKVSVLDVLKNKLYRDADITREFAQFLDAYFRGDRINHILNSQELTNSFQVIKTFKGGSNALTLLVWQDDQMVVKKITLKQYETKLRAQYLWLKKYQKLKRITKVLREDRTHADHYAIDIEYREEFIPFFDVIHSSSVAESSALLLKVCDYVDSHIHQPQKPLKNARKVLQDYIQTKVIGKMTDAANANLDIAHLLGYETLTVNGRELVNFHTVLEQIKNHPQAMADLQDVVSCPIQGDLTVDNIIVNPATGDYLIIDPNDENAISDPIVEYSKLTQSLRSGYEFLYYLPACTVKDNIVTFEERRSVQYSRLNKILDSHLRAKLTPGRYRALVFHEAVHYCRMLTYRTTINPRTAAAFYTVAVRLFNDFLLQYEDKHAAKN